MLLGSPLRLAGLVLVLGSLIPLIPSLGVVTRGNVRATEAMFRDLEAAVGHTSSLRIQAFSWGVWTLISLAGFLILAVVLWQSEAHILAVLSAAAFAIYAVAVVIESAFHAGLTVWAVEQLESGADVPALYFQLKRWLNFYLQILVNPLALLSFVGFGVALLRTGLLWPWACWLLIVYSTVFVLFPLPLLIAPVPFLLGLALLIGG